MKINKNARSGSAREFPGIEAIPDVEVARPGKCRAAALAFVALIAIGAGVVGSESAATAQPVVVHQDAALDSMPAGRRGISGVIRIAPALVDRIGSGDTLFVYAHALDGDPTPLAVVRKRAHELPVAFFLDDSIAINPARLPSRHNQLVIGARVARRGSGAAPAAGDLQGFSAPVRYGQAGVVIVIDSEVK